MARKFFLHKIPHEISFRTEKGLPLVATPYMKLIVKSILARAQYYHPITIIGLLVMSNHVHMIVIPDNPNDVHKFVCYFKKETAHAINRLLGRRRYTVWSDGYDSPPILDGEKLIERLVYLYTNPLEANLVDTIDKYPNYSTWNEFLTGGIESSHKRISRNSIPKLPRNTLSLRQQQEFADLIKNQGLEEYTLRIEPDAWLECYSEFKEANPEGIKQEVIKRIRNKEQTLAEKRSIPVLGVHALKLANIDKPYTPKKHGKKMLCLASIREHRIAFIAWIKELFKRAPIFNDLSRIKEYLTKLPPGLFAPGGTLNANINTAFLPIPF